MIDFQKLIGSVIDSKVIFAILSDYGKNPLLSWKIEEVKNSKKHMIDPSYLQFLLNILQRRGYIHIENGNMKVIKKGVVFNGRQLDKSDLCFICNVITTAMVISYHNR